MQGGRAMNHGNYSARLKVAFLQASAGILPDIVWAETKNDDRLVYPEESPALGQLEVEFDENEITLYFDRIYDHQHHALEDDVPADQCEAAIRDVATEAVEFIRQVVSDQVVFRCGLFVTGSQTNRPPTALSRTWRRLTPWVKEAVWSGRVSSRGIP